jgi:hypothetical protein
MRLLIPVLFTAVLVGLSGCSNSAELRKSEESIVVPAGERAVAGHLVYNVIDSQIFTQLGDESAPRVPHDRFLTVNVTITNTSNVDNPIPAVELVSDSGKVYDELTDGTGAANWLGIVRHVGPGQTARGEVLFDAPAAHYKLRFSDESTNNEILADLPLSYAHEKLEDAIVPTADLPGVTAPTGSQPRK